MIYLSSYNKTLEFQSILEDKQKAIIKSEDVYQRILKDFFNLLTCQDKEILINQLLAIYPQNEFYQQMKKQIKDENPQMGVLELLLSIFSDNHSKVNQENYEFNDKLQEMIIEQNWINLQEILNPKFMQYNLGPNLIKKLREHNFKIIDLIHQCQDDHFQLNSIMLINLLFFIYLPENIGITQEEKILIYQFLTEILGQVWLQFEYYISSFQDNKIKRLFLNLSGDFTKLKSKLDESINQILQVDIDSNSFEILQDLILERLPIDLQLQEIFYLACIYVFYIGLSQTPQILNQKLQKLNKFLEAKQLQRPLIAPELTLAIAKFQEEQMNFLGRFSKFKINNYNSIFYHLFHSNLLYLNKKQHIVNLSFQYYCQFSKVLNLLCYIEEKDKRKIASLMSQLIKMQQIEEIIIELKKHVDAFPNNGLIILFRITQEILNFEFDLYLILKQYIYNPIRSSQIQFIIKLYYSQSQSYQDFDQLLTQAINLEWDLIKNNPIKYMMVDNILQHYLQNCISICTCPFQILRKIYEGMLDPTKKTPLVITYQQLLNLFDDDEVHKFTILNQQQQITSEDYVFSFKILLQLYRCFQTALEKKLFMISLDKIILLKNMYCIENLIQISNEQYEVEFITIIIQMMYEWKQNNISKLSRLAEELYIKDSNIYERFLSKFNFFQKNQLKPESILKQTKYNIYPNNLNITLEEFNISLILLSQQQQLVLVQNWINDVKDSKTFRQLIPFFFNIIKRGESSTQFLSLINREIKKNVTQFKKYGHFNQKALFQIFYLNSNIELQVILLKLMSKQYPIPLLYRAPFDNQWTDDKVIFNVNTIYVHQESFSIINFSLEENQSRIGKTELINKIFYKQAKFEILDNNRLNSSTIDIMYDFEFNDTRRLSIADAHGFIPLSKLDSILPLFNMWIIQLDGEKQIENTIQKLNQLRSFKNKDKVVCFLIRNQSMNLSNSSINEINDLQIEYHSVCDLSDKNLNQQMIDEEIEQVSHFLLSRIDKNNKSKHKTQNEYIQLIKNECNEEQFKGILDSLNLFQTIEQELEVLIQKEDGFYHQNAFPIRSIDWKIKQKKESFQLIQQDKECQNNQQEIKSSIQELENQKNKQQPTQLINLFCKMLQQSNYYLLYLQFVEKIRNFNDHHNYKLQEQNQCINDSIQRLKKEKEALRLNEQNKQISPELMEQRSQKQKEIQQLINELRTNQEIISKRNIGIELFWREIISQKKLCNDSKIDIDPAKIVKEMIQKGESFEFLDGDQLNIDQLFLTQLIQNFNNQGEEKVLVLSILGPQSSGKSTILNKIFGCHFWTSVGRCTKGIYLQLLKIHNTEYFDNLFDYLIILDTEGLQSPNQEDPEFDKRIALFVLSISNIIIVNVKGDITIQFRSLIEMCMFTLGQMKSFTNKKQITWCFNQNNDVNNQAPFLAQLQQIATNLNKEYNNNQESDEIVDYNETLGITTENISILGFASIEKLWKKNENNGIYSNWRQLIINGTFSEEAYQYAISVIKAYVEKCKNSKSNNQELTVQMEDLKCFIQKIDTNWRSISNLPDLLEFSELIQHQQNEYTRQYIDQITRNSNFPDKISYILKIRQQIEQKNQRISKIILDEIRSEQVTMMKAEFDRIKSQLNEKLLSFKNEKQISKKVYIKYQNIIKDRITSEISAYHLQINSEIKAQEAILYKKKGFNKIYKFIENLNQNENELKQYKDNESLLNKSFNQLWNEIEKEHSQEQEKMFTEYCDSIFKVIQAEFKKYLLKSQEQYKEDFMIKLIKQKPEQQEFLQQLSIMQSQLDQIQFISLEQSQKTYQYNENFALTISQKVKAMNQENSILQISNFYRWKLTFFYLKKKDLEEYMKDKFIEELKNYVKKDQTKQQKKAIKEFLDFFIIFQYQITEENLDKLDKGFKFINTKDDSLDVCREQFEISLKFFQKNCNQLMKNQQYQDEIFPITSNFDFNVFKTKHFQNNKYLLKVIEEVVPDFNVQNKDFFNFIDKKNDLKSKSVFKNQIVNIITELMNETKGWNKMYGQVHLLILQEITNDNSNVMQSQINDITKIPQYTPFLITRIMEKIKLKIKEFNQNFSYFGVMLNDLGERCVCNFAIFAIWRLFCFGEWQSTQISIEELQSQKDEQFKKFSADVLQNKQQQSKISGVTLANNIINFAIEIFYLKYGVESSKIFEKYKSESCYDVIKQLDSDILESKDIKVNNDEIFKYISNQTEYLENHIKKKVQNIKIELQNKIIQQLQRDLKYHLEKVEANTKYLYDCTIDFTQAEGYFIGLNNSKEAPTLLFKIVLNCLSGKESTEYSSMIPKDKQDAFSTTNYHKFDQLTSALQNQDGEIQILLHFIRGFKDRIREQITNIDKLTVDIAKLDIQDAIEKIKLTQIGCLEVCPMCKRKCDSDIEDNNHIHQCKNGHQLRGMAGVLIGFHPSLYTCEEIQDDYQIQELENNSTKTWSQIKQIYHTWQFKCLQKEQQQLLKEKYMKIWNNDIGKMICIQLSKKLGNEVYYTPKQEVELSKHQNYVGASHFILILDDSGSMQGEKFNSAKTGLISFLYEISHNAQSRVTIIIFNSSARCVVDYEQPSPSKQEQYIKYMGGGTDFNQAFLLAYQKISNNNNYHNFESLSIFFYTDGAAPFPGKAIGEFQKLPSDLKSKLKIIACTEEKEQLESLEKIVEFFQKECQSGQLNPSMKPIQIGKVWIESISNKTHQIKKC
ncbi:unnamed protein product [Paramecium sonneborni]|uniref:VLIG-type G domain-containing protein n=1 Tax=Paramecium sonneborni TaxID=65129 RepID=A0A8S1Q1I4_9CILI|nr:unnamed protein product [Paramecium sonneborni]